MFPDVADAADPDLDPPADRSGVSIRSQWVVLWMSAFFAAVLLLAFVSFPGFFPAMSPAMSADEVAAFYRDHLAMIRFSMVVFNICAVMLVPFFMLVVVQMKRMAPASQAFAYSFLAATTSGTTLFAIADLFWLVAAFRPERDPELTQMLNDLAWMVFTAPVGMLVVMTLCLALGVWFDRSADEGHEPVFPRWVAPFSVVVGLCMVPAAGAAVATSGPFAWDGAVSLWLRLGAFAVFLVVMFVVLHGAIGRQSRAHDTTAPEQVFTA